MRTHVMGIRRRLVHPGEKSGTTRRTRWVRRENSRVPNAFGRQFVQVRSVYVLCTITS